MAFLDLDLNPCWALLYQIVERGVNFSFVDDKPFSSLHIRLSSKSISISDSSNDDKHDFTVILGIENVKLVCQSLFEVLFEDTPKLENTIYLNAYTSDYFKILFENVDYSESQLPSRFIQYSHKYPANLEQEYSFTPIKFDLFQIFQNKSELTRLWVFLMHVSGYHISPYIPLNKTYFSMFKPLNMDLEMFVIHEARKYNLGHMIGIVDEDVSDSSSDDDDDDRHLSDEYSDSLSQLSPLDLSTKRKRENIQNE